MKNFEDRVLSVVQTVVGNRAQFVNFTLFVRTDSVREIAEISRLLRRNGLGNTVVNRVGESVAVDFV